MHLIMYTFHNPKTWLAVQLVTSSIGLICHQFVHFGCPGMPDELTLCIFINCIIALQNCHTYIRLTLGHHSNEYHQMVLWKVSCCPCGVGCDVLYMCNQIFVILLLYSNATSWNCYHNSVWKKCHTINCSLPILRVEDCYMILESVTRHYCFLSMMIRQCKVRPISRMTGFSVDTLITKSRYGQLP